MNYTVLFKPGSTRGPLVVASSDNPAELTVYLREKPHDGEANDALIKVLSKHFRIAKTSIRLVSGPTSRHKVIFIPD